MKFWKKLTHAEQDARITAALKDNIDYQEHVSLGIPASRLDPNVFYDQAPFLKDAPLLRTYVRNPNHIGCHTLGESEVFFKGTQQLEREVIDILGCDLLQAEENSVDGYIASGGTEANLQAVWIYRNYFMRELGARHGEIGIVCSVDTHYSIHKASNIFHVALYQAEVDDDTRMITDEDMDRVILKAKSEGIRYFIAISNMATTMFGSVDDPGQFARAMDRHEMPFKLHVDGAFGGFIYPVSKRRSDPGFSNPHVSSVTLDAHKMLQAPYGTGIFLARKGLMKYVFTEQASYVSGMDITLSGSRSGANAIAVWMILLTYGPYGWLEKINKLLYRTKWCCAELDKIGISYYRHPGMNIITIRAGQIPESLAERFGLVPDTHSGKPAWYKIVVMDHVEMTHLQDFVEALKQSRDQRERPFQEL